MMRGFYIGYFSTIQYQRQSILCRYNANHGTSVITVEVVEGMARDAF